jgi:hypothetical protein
MPRSTLRRNRDDEGDNLVVRDQPGAVEAMAPASIAWGRVISWEVVLPQSRTTKGHASGPSLAT